MDSIKGAAYANSAFLLREMVGVIVTCTDGFD